MRAKITTILGCILMGTGVTHAATQQRSPLDIRHAYLVTGAQTAIISETDQILWRYPRSTRDGFVLESGNVLLVLNSGKNYSGGVVEVTQTGRTIFQYRGQQQVVNSAQRLPGNLTLIAEGGEQPQIIIVNALGQTQRRIPVATQAKDPKSQISFARAAAPGRILVTLPADRRIREYNLEGKILWEWVAPQRPAHAVRLPSGHILVSLRGDRLVEITRAGKIVWQLTPKDFAKPYLNALSIFQVLSNGNLVLATATPDAKVSRLMEFTRDKKLIWSARQSDRQLPRHFHILTTNGKPCPGPLLR
jgi:hypothetical protein